MAVSKLPRPPRAGKDGQRDTYEMTRWLDSIWMHLTGIVKTAWSSVDFTGSELTDIETRPHSDLQGIEQADETSTDTDGGKHVTDALMNTYQQHIEAPDDVHGVGAASDVVGTETTQALLNKSFGSATDYTEFEVDGTMHMAGAATTYEDLQGSVLTVQRRGSGVSLNTTENSVDFTTSSNLNDYIFDNFQIPHKWEVGSSIYIHCHWWQTEANTPNFLVRYRWQVQGAAKTTAWTDLILTTDAFTYASGTLNQIAVGAAVVPPAGAGISDVLNIQFFRDNANTSTAFTGADAYSTTVALAFLDIHILSDTLGSRTEYIK